MRIDKMRHPISGLLAFASLTLAQGGPVRDTSTHLSGWPPAPSAEILPADTSDRSTTSATASVLAQKTERNPGWLGECVQSVALAFGGVLLAGTGIAYWTHFSEANNYLDRKGVNSLAIPVIATVAIPVGTVMAGLGSLEFLACLAPRGSDD
jgi:hypothetical protein